MRYNESMKEEIKIVKVDVENKMAEIEFGGKKGVAIFHESGEVDVEGDFDEVEVHMLVCDDVRFEEWFPFED